MAPYEGDIADVDVNQLEFFKIGEEFHDETGKWATEKLVDDPEGKWTVKIPADIKPGLYVVRNEVSLIPPKGFHHIHSSCLV
jgi:hypothetical protein